MRGIIPATIINYMEQCLAKKFPNTTIKDHFDLIVGTSTGGILTALYITPDSKDKNKAKFLAKEALDFYVEHGNAIFNQSKKPNWKILWGLLNATRYSPTNIEKLLNKQLGDLKMSDISTPFLITTYNLNSKSSFFFTNNDDKEKYDFYMKDILRSTSAAPTYFPTAKIQNIAKNSTQKEMFNIDGGVFANNPTMCAYAEARKMNFIERGIDKPTAKDMYIVSIGTGGGDYKISNPDNSGSWGLKKWAESIPNIMMDASIDTIHFQMTQIKGTLPEDAIGNYFRIDVPTQKEDPNSNYRTYDKDMANASKENIDELIKAANKTLEFHKEDINNIIRELTD